MSELSIETGHEPPEIGLRGVHVLLIMLAFFGLMFAVNGVFLYHAITSFPGEDVKKSYLQGLNYNETLEARSAQAARGWQAEAGLSDGELVFRLADQAGAPLSGYPAVAHARRLATNADDLILTLQPGLSGEYRSAVSHLAPGIWRLDIRILDRAAETTLFTARKEVMVE